VTNGTAPSEDAAGRRFGLRLANADCYYFRLFFRGVKTTTMVAMKRRADMIVRIAKRWQATPTRAG
jgi:hypothetical protein